MFLTIEQLKAQTPSQRLQFALDALIEMEQSTLFRVDMGTYHSYDAKQGDGGICFACLGGAAAIKAIKGNFNELVNWGCTHEASNAAGDLFIKEFEYSLDYARRGEIGNYLKMFNMECGKIEKNYVVVDYMDSPEDFKDDMKSIIKLLKENGL